MPDIGGITGPKGPGPIDRRPGSSRTSASEGGSTKRQDSVEISAEGSRRADQAAYLARLEQVDSIRQERVEAIRAEVQNGTYDVDARIDQALDGLLGDIGIPAE